ncbi:hypothetical protein [Burkholderia pseudomallei]|uniref:hypothetical protein n=1 Tax=Burkholderia pseudomallei TaxID=28450 RepID=UPI001F543723|nr:hypothetical protein [Burkholderia pseudomallei]
MRVSMPMSFVILRWLVNENLVTRADAPFACASRRARRRRAAEIRADAARGTVVHFRGLRGAAQASVRGASRRFGCRRRAAGPGDTDDEIPASASRCARVRDEAVETGALAQRSAASCDADAARMRAAFTCASLFRPTTACRRDLGTRATCRTLSRAGGAAARVPTRRIDESTNRRIGESGIERVYECATG